MESSLSVCKDPQAEQNRDTERPKQDVAETQRDWRERSTEGDTLPRETGSQRGEQRDPERETERQRQRDREIENRRKIQNKLFRETLSAFTTKFNCNIKKNEYVCQNAI